MMSLATSSRVTMIKLLGPHFKIIGHTSVATERKLEAPSESEASLSHRSVEPRSISRAQRTQNTFTVPYHHGLDLISFVLHDYFQCMYRNEAPASSCFVVFQLVRNKIRHCNR